LDARPCWGAGGRKEGGALSPKAPRARCGPRGLDPYREVGGPGPRRWVRAGDAGSGDPAFRRGGVGPTYLHKKCHSVILAG